MKTSEIVAIVLLIGTFAIMVVGIVLMFVEIDRVRQEPPTEQEITETFNSKLDTEIEIISITFGEVDSTYLGGDTNRCYAIFYANGLMYKATYKISLPLIFKAYWELQRYEVIGVQQQ